MLYGAYVSAAGALAHSYRQDVIANNLANANTVAFKRDFALLEARPTEADARGQARFSDKLLERLGGGLFAQPTHIDFSVGALEKTGRELDLALTKSGFFRVQKGDEIQYSRDGRFLVNTEGKLVTQAEQLPVLDDGGAMIELDLNAPVVVTDSGMIAQNGAVVARLGVVDFEDLSSLEKAGAGFYRVEGNGQPQAVEARVVQGHLEMSGVNTIDELVGMYRSQRLFQTNISMMQMQDQMLGAALSKLGMLS